MYARKAQDMQRNPVIGGVPITEEQAIVSWKFLLKISNKHNFFRIYDKLCLGVVSHLRAGNGCGPALFTVKQTASFLTDYVRHVMERAGSCPSFRLMWSNTVCLNAKDSTGTLLPICEYFVKYLLIKLIKILQTFEAISKQAGGSSVDCVSWYHVDSGGEKVLLCLSATRKCDPTAHKYLFCWWDYRICECFSFWI